MIKYSFPDEILKDSVIRDGRRLTFNYPCRSKNQCNPFTVVLPKGVYTIECWGAGYPLNYYNGYGYGAYTKGSIQIQEQTTFFLYIGASAGMFNAIDPTSVITSGQASGGATDVRLTGGEYSSFNSLKSRIMVAAGAGSSDSANGNYGHGGTLEGFNSTMTFNHYHNRVINPPSFASGGTQTRGGVCNESSCVPGRFGVSISKEGTLDAGSFGGGGYYSGASFDFVGNSGGGSSFISGYKGCDAIDENSNDFNSIIHTGQSIHYSGHKFFNAQMKSGEETQRTEAGKVVIMTLSTLITCAKSFHFNLHISSILLCIFTTI